MNKILAIDPGTNKLGLAVFNSLSQLVKTATISTKLSERYERTQDICGNLMQFIDEQTTLDYNIPDSFTFVCEEPLMQGKANTSMQRLLGALEFLFCQKPNYIHPMTVKKAMGSGSLDKEEVKGALLKFLSDKETGVLERAFLDNHYDETDAVAIGLTYLIQKGYIKDAIKNGKKQKSPKRQHS